MGSHDYYLGFDLSTQQLKGVVVRSDLKLVHNATVDFDAEYAAKYGTAKGTLSNPAEGEIYMPVAMWLEAIDLVLTRLRDNGLDFSNVKCLSGAGMQHGTVFWSHEAEALLADLTPSKSLVTQLEPAFSHPHSPNWQDSSTQAQCDAFNAALGAPHTLADLTGSQAHHRFSGPQIMRFRTKYPSHYEKTARISLVSSFIATVFTGRFAPIDISDVCGMNLWDIKAGAWHEALLALTAGSQDAVPALKERLGHVPEDGGLNLGRVAPYFVQKYGFNPACTVAPSTGDNPATILSLPLRADDAMVSLGTSTTFLMSTSAYVPDPAYHFMNHPTTAGLYMFMLCYKNGGLAREHIRDALNAASPGTSEPTSWTAFNAAAVATPPLGTPDLAAAPAKLGLYFPLHEIVPNAPPGQWNFTYAPSAQRLTETGQAAPWKVPADHARAILESQLLSLRLRSRALTRPQTSADGHALPAQPRRVYLVGGGSVNPAIAQVAGEVLGGAEGVFRLELGGNACALGAAYKAAWARGRRVVDGGQAEGGQIRGGRDTETFEAFVGARWDEAQFVRKVDRGYRRGVYELYGEALPGFEQMERRVLQRVGGGGQAAERRASVSYGTQAPAAGYV